MMVATATKNPLKLLKWLTTAPAAWRIHTSKGYLKKFHNLPMSYLLLLKYQKRL